MSISRRRFIAITAAAAGSAISRPALAGTAMARWTGIALGAEADIRLFGLDRHHAEELLREARAEIDRLEGVFSLYRKDSELARLNRASSLTAPSPEMLHLLTLAGSVHGLSGGRFDPTIQPLWNAYARGMGTPSRASLLEAGSVIGWNRVLISPEAIRIPKGGALTLNGIAQGYITDSVTRLLRSGGLANALVEVGEISALGTPEGKAGWPVRLGDRDGPVELLSDRAVATSAPFGTVIGTDAQGMRQGHLIDPAAGAPLRSAWISASILHRSAAMADALSTAAAMMEIEEIAGMMDKAEGAVFFGKHERLGQIRLTAGGTTTQL